jgi:hypothetical protein
MEKSLVLKFKNNFQGVFNFEFKIYWEKELLHRKQTVKKTAMNF